MSKKQKKQKTNDDFLAQEAKESQATAAAYTIDVPDDEIWDYQIEGLQAPHINKPFENAKQKKILVVIILLISIFAAMYFSVRAVHSDLYKYNQLEDGTYELVRFSNSGNLTDVTIDYVVDVKTGKKDTSKPITKIHEYAFNGDETIHNITFGKDVKEIDQKAIYSCWSLRNVWIDDENPNYCDIDGVVYNKDVTEAIHYPTCHDVQLVAENGYATVEIDKKGNQVIKTKMKDANGNPMDRVWGTDKDHTEQWYQGYNKTCRTYVIPSTVTKLNEMSFAYSDITDLYIPEGVTYIGNMALFKNTALINIYTYKADAPITDTTYKAIDQMSSTYPSIPEGVEFIGSDAFYYTRGLSYMYLPESVKTIKHHAFWDAAFKNTDTKQIEGIAAINTPLASKDEFNSKVETGDQWRPQYDYMAFKKSIDVNYGVKERQSQFAYNINRQYYWAVQWVKNNSNDTVKAKSGYLIKDLDNDGTPELILSQYNEETKKNDDTILTFEYDYLADYKGAGDYAGDKLSSLDDNTSLDKLLETATATGKNAIYK